MNDTVRILILDENTTDYDLAKREIRKSLTDCTFEQVKTRQDFLSALESFQPDVILAEHKLPHLNGGMALELTRKHTPMTPFIIWTDSMSEDAALEYVNAGALTYILKEDFKRLGAEMIRALKERILLAEHRQLEAALTHAKERFEALVLNGQDNISLLDKDGKLLWENPSATSTLGYAINEFKGRNIFELAHPEDQYWIHELFAKLVEEPGRRQEGVFRLRHSNGTWRWIEGTAANMLDNPSVQGIVINYRDITERRESDARIRESEERFSKAFNLGPAALSISQQDGGAYLAVNEAFLELYGYEYNEVVGHTPRELNMYPTEKDAALAMKLLHEQTSFRDQEFEIITKSGELRTVVSSGEAIDLGGEKYVLSFTTDITERKQAEMERQTLLEIMQGLAQTTDLQEFLERIHISVAKVIYAENFFVILYQEETGLFEEIYFVDQYDTPVPPSKLEMSITSYVFRSGKSILMTQALFDELVEQGEVRLVGTNSESWLGVPLKTPNGIIGVIGVQDYENPDRYSEREKDLLASIGSQVAIAIERKRREETLYDSEKRFRSLFENSPISVWEEDFSSVKNKFEQLKEEGIEDIGAHLKSNPELVVECASLIRILDINNATLKLFEAESKDDLTVPLGKILKPESLEFFTEELVQLAAGETSFYWEGINHTLNGRRIYVNLRLSVLPGYEDTLSRVIVSIFDITERKQAEDQLRKLSRAVEQSASAIVITDRAGSIEYVNPKFIETSGYTTEEAFGQNPRILRSGLIPQQTYEQLWKTIVSGKDWNGELLNKKKSGDLYWESATISPIINDQGDITHFIAVKEDITERKRAEEEFNRHLMEMEALYENGLAISGMFSLDEIGQQLIETFSNHLFWHHVTIRLVKNKDDLQLIALNKPGLSKEDKSEAERHFNSMVGKVGQGLAGWVVQTGKTLRTGDVHSHPQYIETQAGIQSGLYTPIKIGNEILGVISVESEKADAFLPEDERLLATLANQAAVAFANANLYQAAQQEIEKRRRVENALRTSESHYRDLANSITDIMFELDQNLRFTHWNKSSELLTGIPRIKALEKTTREVFGDSRDQMEIDKVFLTVLSTRTPKSVEGILGLNGEEHVYEINVYPSYNGIFIIAKDVTERNLSAVIMQKRFELMNFSANSQLEDLVQRMLDEITELIPSQIGFFHFLEEDENTPGKQMWSTQTLQLFNASDSEGHHQPLDQAGVWADALRQRRPVIQNDYISLPTRKGLPDGHVDIYREMVIPIIRDEKLKAVLGIGNKLTDYTQHDLSLAVRFADHALDIIERKRMELAIANERNRLAKRVEERTADLSHANANLARALRVKDEFLANMSHELRTPLNAILGLSESLTEQTAGPLNEKQSSYIKTISESGHHLLSLINDILDLAKIEAGQITLDINKVDVRSISEASLRMVKQLASKKNQNVELDIDKSVGLIWADERRLKQMLVNLLSNAVKFTPDDGMLGLEVRGDQSENQVAFAVWDNGIGIKDHDLSRLFQPFIQLDGGLARENTGTGLGLALVAQMARLHGGSVTVESQSEQGSRFTITLPWEPALSPITTERLRNTGRLAPAKPDKKDRTLLLIEDTPEVTMMLRDYLENAGYKVITAQDGLEGIDKAKLTHPDLILMDIQMPRIDGFEATKRLRNDPEFEYTPIIALTALAMPNDRERCLAAGMDEYISKPVNLRMLLKIIQGFLPSAEQSVKPQ